MILPSGLRDLIVLILACTSLTAQPPSPPAQDLPIRVVEDGAIVELEFRGVPLADVLVAAQPVLGVPLSVDPADVSFVVVNQLGVQRVARDDFRDAFDALLHRYEFWTADDLSGGEPVIRVFKPSHETRFGPARLPITPPFVTVEELAAGPQLRAPIYTVVFNLRHVPAGDVLAAFLDTLRLDEHFESARVVESGNSLVATASREHLLALRDLVQSLDAPHARAFAVDEQLESLNRRLAALELRLAALEQETGG